MRGLKRTILVILSAAVISVTAYGGLLVNQARSDYYGICSTLTGFPGLLQRAGMLASGTCKSLPGGTLCNAGGTCTVNNVAGKCKNTSLPGGTPVCSCVASVSTP
jgi:hypothetical protein